MSYVKSYRELEVYKLARDLSGEIFILSKEFPKDEIYSLTNQIRRSSRSVGSQIAESWGKRRYVNHFVSKLTDADSEQMETQHWIEVAEECKYIPAETSVNLIMKCESIGKMIQAMIDKSDSFCKMTK
ncbi:MAG: four helix bundle protein [Bacteroidales bacterium]|jgi:four helix bundle protein|nr:four helix bundle protein [Bacteroidales bacterium]